MKGTKYMLIGVASSPEEPFLCRSPLPLRRDSGVGAGGGGSEHYLLKIPSAEVLSWAA